MELQQILAVSGREGKVRKLNYYGKMYCQKPRLEFGIHLKREQSLRGAQHLDYGTIVVEYEEIVRYELRKPCLFSFP